MKTSVMVFTGMTVFLDGSCQGDHMMQSGCWKGGERKLSEKRSDIQLHGLPLHVIVHLLAQCHDRIHLHLPAIWKMPFPSFWGRGHNLHSKCLRLMKHWTWWFPWFRLHFSWWNKSLVSHNGIRLTAMFIPYPTHPVLPLSLTKTALSPFYTSALHQHVDIVIKIWQQQTVKKL